MNELASFASCLLRSAHRSNPCLSSAFFVPFSCESAEFHWWHQPFRVYIAVVTVNNTIIISGHPKRRRRKQETFRAQRELNAGATAKGSGGGNLHPLEMKSFRQGRNERWRLG